MLTSLHPHLPPFPQIKSVSPLFCGYFLDLVRQLKAVNDSSLFCLNHLFWAFSSHFSQEDIHVLSKHTPPGRSNGTRAAGGGGLTASFVRTEPSQMRMSYSSSAYRLPVPRCTSKVWKVQKYMTTTTMMMNNCIYFMKTRLHLRG